MKIPDIIFALITGRVVGFLVQDFLWELNITTNVTENIIVWIIFPLLALLGLWLCQIIGRRLTFVHQAGKHLLIGAFATIFDLKLFEWLIWVAGIVFLVNPLVAKGVSFIAATFIKYWGNKYWAFERHENANMRQELTQFFLITIIGLIIDVAVFYGAIKFLGPFIPFSPILWTKLAVIMAALVAAIWNFLGYKFFVFKK